MATSALLRHKAQCDHCGTLLLVPEWTESSNEHKLINIWHCYVCGHEFETIDEDGLPEPSQAELVQELLPDLLVA